MYRKVAICLGTHSVSTTTDVQEKRALNESQTRYPGSGADQGKLPSDVQGSPLEARASSAFTDRGSPRPLTSISRDPGKERSSRAQPGARAASHNNVNAMPFARAGEAAVRARPGPTGGREGAGTCSVGPRPRAGTRGHSCLRLRT